MPASRGFLTINHLGGTMPDDQTIKASRAERERLAEELASAALEAAGRTRSMLVEQASRAHDQDSAALLGALAEAYRELFAAGTAGLPGYRSARRYPRPSTDMDELP
jgi:hypothetical protein